MIAVPAMMGIAVFAFAMLWAAFSDMKSLTIPNGVSILLVVGYVLLAPFAGFSLREMGLSLAAASVTCVMLVLAFRRGWIGGGDVKLMTATALWLGAGQVPHFLLWASIFAGVLAGCALVFRAIPMKPASAFPLWALRLHAPSRVIPFGVAVASAGLMQLWSSAWMQNAP